MRGYRSMLDCDTRGNLRGFVINRRIFLEAAVASALPALAGAGPRATPGQSELPARAAVDTVLVDARHAPARMAAGRLHAAGTQVHTIADGDITQIWLQRIGPAWRQHPVTIAGLTARPALFCLEQLARGCGLRVVFHAEHVLHTQGRTEHQLLRGAQLTGMTARDLALAGSLWPLRIAQYFATYSSHDVRERFGLSAAALHPTLPPGAQLLTSWIIAAV
jgi:hypothetical protein